MTVLKYSLLFLLIAFMSCRQSDMGKYRSLVKSELKNNKKVNDIFFGISLGMTSKDFYMHCWNLNKKGLFTDGMNNTSVAYKLDHNELKHPATMSFYPEFNNGKIHKMWTRFQYDGWMPWNKQLGSDSLLTDVLTLYKKWYSSGNPFITITDKKRGTLYVKVDGNRRIILGLYDDVEVKVDYTDLTVEQKH
ncbi:MAG: hypothetical protein M3342_00870 [Bacteroidota bacterium]|nr:hypothetical protein [Bacteroidota bacterium]